jgi:hypothetical protein
MQRLRIVELPLSALPICLHVVVLN